MLVPAVKVLAIAVSATCLAFRCPARSRQAWFSFVSLGVARRTAI